MAYAVPPRWSHGDTISVANMNKYSDALNALKTQIDAMNKIIALNQTTVGYTSFLWHQQDWLYYKSASGETATIVDLSGANDDTTLADSTAAVASYDLRSVSWLTHGTLYKVTGVDFVAEDTA